MPNRIVYLLVVSFVSQFAVAEEAKKSWSQKASELYADYVEPNWQYIAGGALATGAAIVGGAALLGSSKSQSAQSSQHPLPDIRASRPRIPPHALSSHRDPSAPAPATAMRNFEMTGSDGFLMQFAPAFAKFGNMAVFDAGTYKHMIKDPTALMNVLARANAPVFNPIVNGARAKSQSMANSFHTQPRLQQLTGEEKVRVLSIIQAIRKGVELGRGGICTTFAFAATDLLLEEAGTMDLRVEIMAHRGANLGTHLFVVVGREPSSSLNDLRGWGPKARVVDLWYRALLDNNVSGVFTIDQYAGMLNNLEIIFDSSILAL